MSRKRRGGGAFCDKCGDPIRWARTQRGSWIPLSADPDPHGNLLFTMPGEVVTLSERERIAEAQAGAKLFLPHQADCSATRPRQPVPEDQINAIADILKRGGR